MVSRIMKRWGGAHYMERRYGGSLGDALGDALGNVE